MFNPFENHMLRERIEIGSINFIGKPFAGKDVQAARFAREARGVSLGAGQILRDGRDELSEDDRAIFDGGGLVPSDTFRRAITPALRKIGNRPLLLSGVGRMAGEPQPVIEALDEVGHPLLAVVYLDISDDELFRRAEGNQRLDANGNPRTDDGLEIISNRIATFNEQTLPALDEYQASGVPFIEFKADGFTKNKTHQIAKHALLEILRN